MNYVENLIEWICGKRKDNGSGQVNSFIKRILRKEDISNDVRREELSSLDPLYAQT